VRRESPGPGNSAALDEIATSASVIHTIFEGTSEIQQLVIARAISGLRIE
jgi:alkylation response protein AidB-like acyl-CoA dehydrogenase